MMGTKMSVAEVLTEVLKDRIFYDDSGGGVTVSGGEPLAQLPFLQSLLEACRAEAIHTAVDTCGFAPQEDLLSIAPLTDLFLYDLKMMEDDGHRRLTGVSNTAILDNLKKLGSVDAAVRISFAGRGACYNILYALEGAIRGIRWHKISKKDRDRLRVRFDEKRGA